MSAGYPAVGPDGRVQLQGIVCPDGTIRLEGAVCPDGLHLIVGHPDDPGAAELLTAILALITAANTHHDHGPAGPGSDKRAAWGLLLQAVEALHLAGLAA